MWSRAIAGVLLGVTIQVLAQDRETVLFDFDAYNPVPSPDGKLIAYDLTGRKLIGGSGGFGRSNLLSQIEFSDLSGNNRRNPNVEGFLGEWPPDSRAIATYRDWQFALVGPDGIKQHGAMPKPFFEDRQVPEERATYLPTLGEFVWIGCEDIGTAQQRTVLKTKSGPIASLNILLPA